MTATKNLLSVLVLLYLMSISLNAQTNGTNYTDSLNLRIAKVENSLSPLVLTKGKPLWNIEERMKKYNIPGLSLAIINDYKIEWAKGYGKTDNSKDNKVTPETVFQAASMSKFVNAVALMKSRESSQINLDVDINTLLKTWQLNYNKNQPITLRQLLSHSAGLSTHGFSGYKGSENLPNMVEILNGEKPANSDKIKQILSPNEKFKYSGGGTTISQLILMDKANSTYERFLHEKIFDPLQMTNSFYSIEFDKYPDDIAIGHSSKGKRLKNNYNIYPESAAAGLWTTPTDLAKLIIDIQVSLKNEAGKILSKESSNELIKPTLENSNSALGVFIEKENGTLYLQHSGSNKGFRGKFYFSADHGNGIVIMVNGTNTKIIEEIIRSVAMVYNWAGHERFTVSEELDQKDVNLSTYTGTYIRENREVEVTLKKGRLILTEKGKWSSKLTPLNTSKFVIDIVKPKATIEFIFDSNDSVSKCILKQGESTEWIKKS